jgi:hypothetical protein
MSNALQSYKLSEEDGGSAVYFRVCPKCSRFVKADKTILVQGSGEEAIVHEPNATCKKHGRVEMPFMGYF